jgi:threonine synthase
MSQMTAGWQSFLQKLECTACGGEFDADTLHGVCPTCGKVLFARYDLSAVKKSVTADDFRARRWDMWRYHELLPVRDPANVIALGEGMTPLLRVSTGVSAHLGFERGRLGIKDEGKNPTGSFKDRGMAVAVSRALARGAPGVVCASTGNTSASAAVICANMRAATDSMCSRTSLSARSGSRCSIASTMYSWRFGTWCRSAYRVPIT